MQSLAISLESDYGSEWLSQNGRESHHQCGGQETEVWGVCCTGCPQWICQRQKQELG